MSYDVVTIKSVHIEQIVAVHMRALPNFFLTFMGPKFLREIYRYYVHDPIVIGFVAEDEQNGEVLGFVVGPLTPKSCFKTLIRNRWWMFGLASIIAVLKRPTIVKRLLCGIFYRGQAPPGPKRALLSSIAIAPEAQNKGIGKLLVKRWVEEVKKQGGKGCYLTTDAENNEKVNNFYQNLGWRIESAYVTPEGRAINRYVFDFSEVKE